MLRTRLTPLLLIAGLAAGPTACVSPADKDAVSQIQLDATARLAESYLRDLGALRALADTLLTIQEETERTRIESILLQEYVSAAGDADLEMLAANLRAPATEAAHDPLVSKVRAGRFTSDSAAAWLEDFSLAWRMNAGASVRTDLLTRLEPVQNRRIAREELLAALDAHAQDVSNLFTDALSSGAALAQARALERELSAPAAGALLTVWNDRILANVKNPATRDLLRSALADILPSVPSTPAESAQ